MTQRIFFSVAAALGDVVYATAVCHQVRLEHPVAHITWAVLRQYMDLLKDNPDVNEVMPFDGVKDPIEPVWSRIKQVAANGKYDLTVLPQIYPDHHQSYLDVSHNKDYLTLMCENAGLLKLGSRKLIFVRPPEVETAVSEILSKYGVSSPYVALSYVSYTRNPAWSLDVYRVFADFLRDRGISVIALSASGDPTLPGHICLQGYPLGVVASIIGRSNCYVGVDSGLTALAFTTDVAVVVLRGNIPLINKRMSAIAMGLDKYNDVNEFYCNHDGEHLTGVEELIVAKEMY